MQHISSPGFLCSCKLNWFQSLLEINPLIVKLRLKVRIHYPISAMWAWSNQLTHVNWIEHRRMEKLSQSQIFKTRTRVGKKFIRFLNYLWRRSELFWLRSIIKKFPLDRWKRKSKSPQHNRPSYEGLANQSKTGGFSMDVYVPNLIKICGRWKKGTSMKTLPLPKTMLID